MTSPERSNEDQDDSATSVAAIESQKENIVPLPQGRSASQLSSLLQFASPARHARLAERHAEFAREVEGAADLDDPLEVHYRYVRWIQDNYPQGQSAESNLLPVLERLTRSFRQDRRYRNDPRYIRCWILYAQNISDPNVVFEYMQVNDLGQDLAAYYEEYSIHLEEIGRINKADELYRIGIERKVEPLNRLRRRYKEFLLRHTDSPEDAEIRRHGPLIPLQDHPAEPPTPRSHITRVPLGVPTGDGRSVVANRAPGISGAGLRKRREVRPASRSSKITNNNVPLTIYQDGDQSPSQGAEEASPWPEIGTVGSRREENVQEPGPWVGQGMGRSGGDGQERSGEGRRLEGTGERLHIYRDPPALSSEEDTRSRGEVEDRMTSTEMAGSQMPLVAKNKLLMDSPFHYFSQDSPKTREIWEKRSKRGMGQRREEESKRRRQDHKRREEEMYYSPTMAILPDGTERSVEEIRAYFYLPILQEVLNSPNDSPQSSLLSMGDDEDEISVSSEDEKNSKRSGNHSFTLFTKKAMQDVEGMFNASPSHTSSLIKEDNIHLASGVMHGVVAQGERMETGRKKKGREEGLPTSLSSPPDLDGENRDAHPLDALFAGESPPRDPTGQKREKKGFKIFVDPVEDEADETENMKQKRWMEEGKENWEGGDEGRMGTEESGSKEGGDEAMVTDDAETMRSVDETDTSKTMGAGNVSEEARPSSYSPMKLGEDSPHAHGSGSPREEEWKKHRLAQFLGLHSPPTKFQEWGIWSDRQAGSVVPKDPYMSRISEVTEYSRLSSDAPTRSTITEEEMAEEIIQKEEDSGEEGVQEEKMIGECALEKVEDVMVEKEIDEILDERPEMGKEEEMKKVMREEQEKVKKEEGELMVAKRERGGRKEGRLQGTEGIWDARGRCRLVNPLSPRSVLEVIRTAEIPLPALPGFHGRSKQVLGLLPKMEEEGRELGETGRMNRIVQLGDDPTHTYTLGWRIGHGVYVARAQSHNRLMVLKGARPAIPLEFYLSMIAEARGLTADQYIIHPWAYYLYCDESYQVSEWWPHGTVLDLIQRSHSTHPPVTEALALLLALETGKRLMALHQVGILHGNVQPDHLLISFPRPTESISEDEEDLKEGVVLSDLSCGVDIGSYEEDVRFRGAGETMRDVEEMVWSEGEGWRFGLDWVGLVGVVYSMGHGRRLEVMERDEGWEAPGITTRLASPSSWSVVGPEQWDAWLNQLLFLGRSFLSDDEVEKGVKMILDEMETILEEETHPGRPWGGDGPQSLQTLWTALEHDGAHSDH